MAKIIINKDYFKNLPKGTHTLRANFKDGYAEGQFEVNDKITFYIGEDDMIPFTATAGQNWSQWMSSFNIGGYGNFILWLDNDFNLYIDPRCEDFKYTAYSDYSLGNVQLRFMDSEDLSYPVLTDIIKPNHVYRCEICCFDAGTQILMADGQTKDIEKITIGDKVLSYNESTGQLEIDEVTNTIIKHNSDDLVYIKLSDGTQLGMRAYHPLLTVDGWKSLRPELAETLDDLHCEVPLLGIGDVLIGAEKNLAIVGIENRAAVADYDTYNITIAKNHNYIANGVVAHNASAPSCK
jgi:hypothetical protein